MTKIEQFGIEAEMSKKLIVKVKKVFSFDFIL